MRSVGIHHTAVRKSRAGTKEMTGSGGMIGEMYVHLGSAAAIQCPMFNMTYEAAQAICSCILALARAITLIIRMSVPSKDTGMK